MDRNMPFAGAKGARGAGRTVGQAPEGIGRWEKGRQSVEMMRNKSNEVPRKSTELDMSEGTRDLTTSSRNSGDAPRRHSSLDSMSDGVTRSSMDMRGSSLSLDEQVGNPCSPWHPCDNNCLRKQGKAKRLSEGIDPH